MADYTAKLGLKKPAETDYVDIADINGNMDTLDEAFARYAVCSTAAATAAKTVTIPGYKLFAGAVVYIKFNVTNTAPYPTLDVNSTGAAQIYYRGGTIVAGTLAANRTYAFVYNGTQYELIGDINTDTKYSVFTGATTSAAGKTGLVPAPAAGYNNRFLRGDGTWAEAGGMDLDALASNTDPMEIQGEGANNATGLTLRQKNASYDDMIQTLEMKSFYGPPGRVYRTYLKQGSDPTGTEGTDYIGFEWYSNYNHMSGHFRPLRDSAYTLGDSTTKWSVVYATNGTIQTSDRRRKNDIRLVPQKDQTAEETPALTQEDLLDFVRNVDIYTYVSDPEHTKTVQDAMAANEYEKIHIGIMANDLVGSKIFPFVGHKDGSDENAPVGMKYESLGVVALYAIRALYDRIDKLETRIEELETSGK
jgi:hypothetical protein